MSIWDGGSAGGGRASSAFSCEVVEETGTGKSVGAKSFDTARLFPRAFSLGWETAGTSSSLLPFARLACWGEG